MGKIKEVKLVGSTYVVKGDDDKVINNSFHDNYCFLEGYDEFLVKFKVIRDFPGGLKYKKGDRFVINQLGKVSKS